MFEERREMMGLAAITYRGFSDATQALPHWLQLHGAVERSLEDLAPTRGRWELVWGPEVYRAPLSVLDDAMMYVVRSRADRRRYVVAIRGTNPVSAFDWLFGDLWVTVQLPWPYGNAPREAKISLSTALGLGLLQSMRSRRPPAAAADVWRHFDGGLGALFRLAGNQVLALGDRILHPVLAAGREALLRLSQASAARQQARMALPADQQAAALLADWSSAARQTAVREIAALANPLVERYSGVAFAALQLTAAASTDGMSLVQFLRAASETASPAPLDVSVVGHSKGGCLASTVALWLADSTGARDVPAEQQWNPAGDAAVRCYSFAGPTGGNAAFAAYSNRVIGARCERTVNTLDVVPHAWQLDDLRRIADLFGPGIDRAPIVDLVHAIVADLETTALGYTHPGEHLHSITGTLDPTKPLFFDQFAHQHMAAYLTGLGLGDSLTVPALFARL